MHKHTRMLVYDHGSDAHVEITEYADAPSSVSDPYVRSRIAPQGKRAGAETLTEFGPAPVRPISYPKALPFVPGERSKFMLQMWDVPETLFHSPQG